MNNLYLIRGLPGTGKSTLANSLGAYRCEADEFFMFDGEYKYDAARISEAHEYCQHIVKMAMEDSYTRIAVANTFTQRWEMKPYYDMAERYGYTVTEITLSGKIHGNIHNVPEEKIERMRSRWEQ